MVYDESLAYGRALVILGRRRCWTKGS